jgi:hypothetical protein
MLQREDGPLETHCFLVSIDFDPKKVTPQAVINHMSDALAWMEGTGATEFTHVGILTEEENDGSK